MYTKGQFLFFSNLYSITTQCNNLHIKKYFDDTNIMHIMFFSQTHKCIHGPKSIITRLMDYGLKYINICLHPFYICFDMRVHKELIRSYVRFFFLSQKKEIFIRKCFAQSIYQFNRLYVECFLNLIQKIMILKSRCKFNYRN